VNLKAAVEGMVRALEEELDLARRQGTGIRYVVTSGYRVGGSHSSSIYVFSCKEGIQLRDETPIQMHYYDQVVAGSVVAHLGERLTLALENDLGDRISGATIEADTSFILRSIKDQLDALHDRPSSRLNLDMAGKVIGMAPPSVSVKEPAKGVLDSSPPLNPFQEKAVRLSMGSDVTVIWGPPGTGKSKTLAHIVEGHYRAQRSVLVVSHTNVAVDSVFAKVIDRLIDDPGFQQCDILRFGPMADAELLEKYGDFVSPDKIIERRHAGLCSKQEMLKGELKKVAPPGDMKASDSKAARTIKAEIGEVDKELQYYRDQLSAQCRIVATTVHRTFLPGQVMRTFDVVVIDEASMLLGPMAFWVAGLATVGIVVAGDFRQLPPVVRSDGEYARRWLKRGVFEHLGVPAAVAKGDDPPYLALLEIQYRMHKDIGSFVSSTFYAGRLKTGEPVIGRPTGEVLGHRTALLYLDTSQLDPWVSRRMGDYSRYNLTNVILSYHLAQRVLGADGPLPEAQSGNDIAIISPYNAQARLTASLLSEVFSGDDDPPIGAATVHRFQGSERKVVIIDLPGSSTLSPPGRLIRGKDPSERGVRLLNVALSRAKDHVILVANFDYLMHNLEQREAVWRMLKHFRDYGRAVALPQTVLRDYHRVRADLAKDLESARRGVIIFSPYLSSRGLVQWLPQLRAALSRGAAVKVVTTVPGRSRSRSYAAEAARAIEGIRGIGGIVDYRNPVFERMVIVDGRAIWHGSASILSGWRDGQDFFVRESSPALVATVTEYTSPPGLKGVDPNELAGQRNPDCQRCGSPGVLVIKGIQLHFECSADCGWRSALSDVQVAVTNDLSSVSRGRSGVASRGDREQRVETQICPGCGEPMVLRDGRFGPFWGCSNYPKCEVTVSVTDG